MTNAAWAVRRAPEHHQQRNERRESQQLCARLAVQTGNLHPGTPSPWSYAVAQRGNGRTIWCRRSGLRSISAPDSRPQSGAGVAVFVQSLPLIVGRLWDFGRTTQARPAVTPPPFPLRTAAPVSEIARRQEAGTLRPRQALVGDPKPCHRVLFVGVRRRVSVPPALLLCASSHSATLSAGCSRIAQDKRSRDGPGPGYAGSQRSCRAGSRSTPAWITVGGDRCSVAGNGFARTRAASMTAGWPKFSASTRTDVGVTPQMPVTRHCGRWYDHQRDPSPQPSAGAWVAFAVDVQRPRLRGGPVPFDDLGRAQAAGKKVAGVVEFEQRGVVGDLVGGQCPRGARQVRSGEHVVRPAQEVGEDLADGPGFLL